MRPAKSSWRSSPTRLSPCARSAAMVPAHSPGERRNATLARTGRQGRRSGGAELSGPRSVPLDLRNAFARFRGADPDRLHFAAHSHHLWPDVTREAQLMAWDDAAQLADGKWERVLNEVWTDVAVAIARHLRLPDPNTLVPAPNTHEFVKRLLSACPVGRPARVLATDGEFHSFRRQMERLREDGLVELALVPAEPFGSLRRRLIEAGAGGEQELVFVSQVLFESGYALADLDGLVDALAAPGRLLAIDGYHGFL